MSNPKAQLYGVGVGPGDPELLTLKAFRIIQEADVITYVTNGQGNSLAKNIAAHALESRETSRLELAIPFLMSIDRKEINEAYDNAATSIREHLDAGKNVAFLCEGDPLFFGSFIYMMDRISLTHSCVVIPGITSVNAASAQLATPLTMLTEDMAVISSRSSDTKITDTLTSFDTIAILKAGPHLPRLTALLSSVDRQQECQYIEYATHENEKIVSNLAEFKGQKAPYFSLLLVTRAKREYRAD